MDWQKTLNLVAIGLVAWLLLIEWEQYDSEKKQEIASVESYLPAPEAGDLPVPQADDLGSELPMVMQEPMVEL